MSIKKLVNTAMVLAMVFSAVSPGFGGFVNVANAEETSDNAIISFSLSGNSGIIILSSIAVTVPSGTDVTALAPTIMITGASVSPASGVAQDFTNPVTYTVTATGGSTGGSTTEYKVKVSFVSIVEQATLAVEKNNSVSNSVVNPGVAHILVGSYKIAVNDLEDVILENIKANFSQNSVYDNISLEDVAGNTIGEIGYQSPDGSVAFSGLNYVLTKSQTKIINIRADVLPFATGRIVSTLGDIQATGNKSGTSITTPLSVTGQTVSVVVIGEDGTQGGVSKLEYDALVALYNSTDGDNWTNHTGWFDPNVPVSGWYGVYIQDGVVTGLNLGNNNLIGVLPIEIGLLKNLIYLDVQQNSFSGSIPEEIFDLPNLKYLNLRVNEFGGGISKKIGQLNELKTLYLSYNKLSGEIPPEMGNLSNLRSLGLYENLLTGSLPAEIGKLQNLINLDVGRNQLSGNIPNEIGNLSSLSEFKAGSNKLSGPIPGSIGNLTNLRSLELFDNNLSGQLPTEMSNMQNLTDLFLWENKITGKIPSEFVKLKKMSQVYLYNNQIDEVSNEIIAMEGLVSLNLGGNLLSVLPDFSKDVTLTQLVVNDNMLTFEDLEPNMSKFGHYSWYSPQANIKVELGELTLKVGDTLTLDVTVGGTANKYQWFQDGVAVSEISSTSSYVKEHITKMDFGEYTCQITNDIVTGLTLISTPILVKNSIPPAPTATAPGFPLVEPVDPINVNSSTLYKVIIDPGENSTSSEKTTFSVRLRLRDESTPCIDEFMSCEEDAGVVYMQDDGSWGDIPAWFTYDQLGGSSGKIMKNLVGDTNYYISVAARNSDGTGTEYCESTIFYLIWTVPPEPITLSDITTSSVTLNWNSGGGTEHEFLVLRSDGSEEMSYTPLSTIPVSPTTTAYSYLISGLIPNTLYIENSYHIAAQDHVSASYAHSPPFKTLSLPDTTPPVITLNGSAEMTITFGESYTELGATAIDTVDGHVAVVITGSVDTNTLGNYTVTYTAADVANNITIATRTVHVVAAPVTLSSVAITTPATKLSYTVGDSLDIAGLVITGTYSDASTKIETVTIANITGFNSSAPAVGQVLIVSVSGKTTTYTIKVVAPVAPVVTPPSNGGSSGGGGGGSITYQQFVVPAGTTLQASVANGTTRTAQNQITLSLYGGANAARMAISNNPDFIGASQEQYITTKVWTLSAGDGPKTVYVKFYNFNGNASPVLIVSVAGASVVTPVLTPISTPVAKVLGEKITKLDNLIATLKPNKRNAKVKELQGELKKFGFFSKLWVATDFYGPLTAAAVKRYQASKQSTATTMQVLGEKITKLDNLIATLKPNKRDAKVKELQGELKKAGFYPKNWELTGYYGPVTKAGVEKYLAANNQ